MDFFEDRYTVPAKGNPGGTMDIRIVSYFEYSDNGFLKAGCLGIPDPTGDEEREDFIRKVIFD